jgi:hypothetical protein
MRIRPWLARCLLAALCIGASEIILWTHPTGRSPLDWLLLVGGYIGLSALLLDVAARYRARDIFGVLALSGLYGLLNSLLLNPESALVDVPRTWATRVMGAHTLMGLGALAVLLYAPPRRILWLSAGLVGLLWGVWVRWLATFTEIIPADVPLPTMLIAGTTTLLVVLLLWRLNGPEPVVDLQLTRVESALVVALLAINGLRNFPALDVISVLVLGTLIAYCWLLLWFQKRDTGSTVLAQRQPTGFLTLLIAGVILLITGAVGHSLPFESTGDQLALMIGIFAAFGLVWLPAISLVLGVRSYRSLGRQKRL